MHYELLIQVEHGKEGVGKLKKEMKEKETRYQQITGEQSYEIDRLTNIWPQVACRSMAEPGEQNFEQKGIFRIRYIYPRYLMLLGGFGT